MAVSGGVRRGDGELLRRRGRGTEAGEGDGVLRGPDRSEPGRVPSDPVGSGQSGSRGDDDGWGKDEECCGGGVGKGRRGGWGAGTGFEGCGGESGFGGLWNGPSHSGPETG